MSTRFNIYKPPLQSTNPDFSAPTAGTGLFRAIISKPPGNTGIFQSVITRGSSASIPRVYILPESFATGSRTRIATATNVPARLLSENILKIDRDINTEGYHISIVGYDFDKNVRIGITTDTSKSNYPGTRVWNQFTNSYSDIYWIGPDTSHISVGHDGFVYLPGVKLSAYLNYYADYVYNEDDRLELNYDLNPITNQEVIGKRVVLFLRGTYRFTDPHDSCLHYMLVDGQTVTKSSYWHFPATYINSHEFELGLQYLGVKVIAELIPYDISNIQVSDFIPATEAGGGLDPEQLKALPIGILNSLTDLGYLDGEPVYASHLYYCHVSPSILLENGGPLEREDVERLIKKHAPLGAALSIRFSDLEPFVTLTWDNGSITATWNDCGKVKFNLYMKASDESEFSLIDSVYSAGGTNTYTIDGLDAHKTYEVYVTAFYYGIEGKPGNVAMIAGPQTELSQNNRLI